MKFAARLRFGVDGAADVERGNRGKDQQKGTDPGQPVLIEFVLVLGAGQEVCSRSSSRSAFDLREAGGIASIASRSAP